MDHRLVEIPPVAAHSLEHIYCCFQHSIFLPTKSSLILLHLSTQCHLATLRWRHNDHDGVSNHQPRGCLLNRLFRRRSKKTSKLRVTGLCVGNSPGPANSPHKGPVTRKMLPFDDVIMRWVCFINFLPFVWIPREAPCCQDGQRRYIGPRAGSDSTA